LSLCDPNTFKTVFFDWSKPLQRFIQSKGFDMAQSADLTQDAFIRLWNNCSKVSLGKSKSYLFTIAKNLVIDAVRKQQTQLKLKALPIQQSQLVDGQYELEMAEFKIQLETAINSMTPASKEVFMLHRFNDMSYKAIAEQLNISIKAVEKRMSKALKHLVNQNIKIKR